VTLKAIPKGTIHYTLDGSNPRSNGGVCDGGAVLVPDGCDLLLAVAEAEGIWSEQLRVDVPKASDGGDGQAFEPDLTRPALWRRKLNTSDRGQAFRLLECLKRHRADATGADLTVSLQGRSDDYIAMNFGPSTIRSAEALEGIAVDLIGQLTGNGGAADVSLRIDGTRFPSGTALVEAAKELGEPLRADEVRQ
jgi:hypothetical protein